MWNWLGSCGSGLRECLRSLSNIEGWKGPNGDRAGIEYAGVLFHSFNNNWPPTRYVEVIEPEQELFIRISDRSVSYKVSASFFKHHS